MISVSSTHLTPNPPEGPAVIRFLCPNCSRRYELPEALARLPLVCKGCGQPLVVPETSTEPEAKPEPPRPAPPPPPKPEPPKVAAPPPPPPPKPEPPRVVVAPPSPPPIPSPERVAVAVVESRLPHSDHPLTNGQPAAYPKNDPLFEQPDILEALEIAPPTPPDAPVRPADRKLTTAIVDGIVALVLVAIGVFCGELLARQSTSEVIRDAGSAAKFPPIDLLMWLAPPVLFLLIYSLLISRGKSVGCYVRRRIENYGQSSIEEVAFDAEDHSFRRALLIGAMAFGVWMLGVRAWNVDAEVLGKMTFLFFAPAIATGILARGRYWSWLLIGAVFVVVFFIFLLLPILTRLPK